MTRRRRVSRRYNLRSGRTSPRHARRPVHVPVQSCPFEPVAVHGGRALGQCLNGAGEPAFRARRRRCRGTAPDGRRRSREGSAGCRGACGGGRDGARRRKGDSLQPRRGFPFFGAPSAPTAARRRPARQALCRTSIPSRWMLHAAWTWIGGSSPRHDQLRNSYCTIRLARYCSTSTCGSFARNPSRIGSGPSCDHGFVPMEGSMRPVGAILPTLHIHIGKLRVGIRLHRANAQLI